MRIEGFQPWFVTAFEAVFDPWMRGRIHDPVLLGEQPDVPGEAPLIFVSNHSSWWDPFILRRLQRRMRPGAPFYSIMLRDALARHRFLRRMGAIGIDPSASASVAHGFRATARRLRAVPTASVVFFPQGRIWPSSRRPLGFERGIEVLARLVPGALVLPVAIHLEPLDGPRATPFVRVGRPIPAGSGDGLAGALERVVTAELDHIADHLARFGESAARESAHAAGPATGRPGVSSRIYGEPARPDGGTPRQGNPTSRPRPPARAGTGTESEFRRAGRSTPDGAPREPGPEAEGRPWS